ncbi:MAG: thioredoxin 1 [Saprospiraceae bacterium]|jgi:thioredoxin 1
MTFKELIASEKPVLIDFYADWCGPCKAFAPILENLKTEVGDTAQIVKIDVDKNQELSVKYKVNSIPTVMIFQNSELKWRATGSQTVNFLKREIDKLLEVDNEGEQVAE